MTRPFLFARTPSIIFGPGKISLLPGLIRKFGNNAALLTGKNSFFSSEKSSGLPDDLRSAGISIHMFSIPGEPSPDMIDGIAGGLRDKGIEVVAAVGGGSVLDAGKAVSAMITVARPVMDFLENVGTMEHPGSKVPFIAVPTTSGTGSEATKNAVISKTGKNGFKNSLRHDNFVPDIALVDPGLTSSCPPDITAASGLDCYTQLTEAFLSTKSTVYTDAIAIEGIRAVIRSLEKAWSEGSDTGARSDMSFAALTSGICLANAGLGVVHGFASSIGGMYDIPHGLICGTLMGVSNEITLRKLRNGEPSEALKKYTVLGQLVVEKEGMNDSYYADAFVNYLHELTAKLGLKGLKTAGVRREDFNDICSLTGNKNNPAVLGKDEMIEILERRFV